VIRGQGSVVTIRGWGVVYIARGEIVDEGYRKDFYKKIFKKVIQNN